MTIDILSDLHLDFYFSSVEAPSLDEIKAVPYFMEIKKES